MNRSNKLVATNKCQWLVIIAICLLSIAVAVLWREETLLTSYRVFIGILCFLTALYSFFHAVYSAEMSNDGIICAYFGKVHQDYLWSEIKEVLILRDYRFNLRISGYTRIVLVSNGCPSYDSKKWSGIHYLIQFHNKVIWVDNSKINRTYIEERFGEIKNLS